MWIQTSMNPSCIYWFYSRKWDVKQTKKEGIYFQGYDYDSKNIGRDNKKIQSIMACKGKRLGGYNGSVGLSQANSSQL